MKQLFLTLCLSVIFNISLMGQNESEGNIPKDILDCLVEMGTDTISTLNVYESKYLNFFFKKDKGTFDFYGKKIVFFTGNTGTIKSTKKEYFGEHKRLINNGRYPFWFEQLVIFNNEEVVSTGYDAVIITDSKKYLTNKEVIKRLSGKH